MIEFTIPDSFSQKDIEEQVQKLSPWKKGPFKIGDYFLDAEWRSDLKWERLQGMYQPLQGKWVADIGCNNGYFMLQMLKENPAKILGFDPVDLPYEQFQFLKQFFHDERIEFLKEGVESIDRYSENFDTVFCLGILYHHRDPLGILKKIHSSMKKNGELILENMGIPGDEPTCLVPSGRYAGARGMWFIPTASAIENWLRRSGFKSIETRLVIKLDSQEQRRTKDADIQSLKNFLSEDRTQTIEGYPAPVRIYTRALKQ